jgi:hypothetical protein
LSERGLLNLGATAIQHPLRIQAFDACEHPQTRSAFLVLGLEDENNTLEVFLYEGNRFKSVSKTQMEFPVTSIAIGDYDNCGNLEVAVTLGPGTEILLYRVNTAGTSIELKKLETTENTSDASIDRILASDIDGDGIPEIVAIDEHGQIMWFKTAQRDVQLDNIELRREVLMKAEETREGVFKVVIDVAPNEPYGVMAAACWDNVVRVKTLVSGAAEQATTSLEFNYPVYAIAAKAKSGGYHVTGIDIAGKSITLNVSDGSANQLEHDFHDDLTYGVYTINYVTIPGTTGIGILVGCGDGELNLYILDPKGENKPSHVSQRSRSTFMVRDVVEIPYTDSSFADFLAHVELEAGREEIFLARVMQSPEALLHEAEEATVKARNAEAAGNLEDAERQWQVARTLWQQIQASPPNQESLEKAKEILGSMETQMFKVKVNAFKSEIEKIKKKHEQSMNTGNYIEACEALETGLKECEEEFAYVMSKPTGVSPDDLVRYQEDIEATASDLFAQRTSSFNHYIESCQTNAGQHSETKQYTRALADFKRMKYAAESMIAFLESKPIGSPPSVDSQIEKIREIQSDCELKINQVEELIEGGEIVTTTVGNVLLVPSLDVIGNEDGTATLKVTLTNTSLAAARFVRMTMYLDGEAGSFEEEYEDNDKEITYDTIPASSESDSKQEKDIMIYPLLGGTIKLHYNLTYSDFANIEEVITERTGELDSTTRVERLIDGRKAAEIADELSIGRAKSDNLPLRGLKLSKDELDDTRDLLLGVTRRAIAEIYGARKYVPSAIQKVSRGTRSVFSYQVLVNPKSPERRGVIEVQGNITLSGGRIAFKGWFPKDPSELQLDRLKSILQEDFDMIKGEGLLCKQCGVRIRKLKMDDVNLDMLTANDINERQEKSDIYPDSTYYIKKIVTKETKAMLEIECPYCGTVDTFPMAAILR